MRKIITLFALLLAVDCAVAQDSSVPFDSEAVKICMFAGEVARAGEECIGQEAWACHRALSEQPGSLAACFIRELEFWEAEMLSVLLSIKERNTYIAKTYNKDVDIDAVQATWLAYREQYCHYLSKLLDASSDDSSGVAAAECMVELTGRHTLWLHDALRSY